MTPLETAAASAHAISQLSSQFMLDPATYTRGGELGFSGLDFYVTGRGGALGPVDADVVAASFVFFEPGSVRAAWEAGIAVLEPVRAAEAFAAAGHVWAAQIGDDVDCARLAALAGAVVTTASPAGAPLFAAWRAMPEPSAQDPKALALHRMNVLRELRGGLHGAATLTNGLHPLEAVAVKTPYMAPVFGWLGDLPDVETKRDLWQQAEDATNVAMAPAFAGLTESERAELVALADAALASVQ